MVSHVRRVPNHRLRDWKIPYWLDGEEVSPHQPRGRDVQSGTMNGGVRLPVYVNPVKLARGRVCAQRFKPCFCRFEENESAEGRVEH